MKQLGTNLPVEAVLEELEEALTHHSCAVLCAEPGAGKSTLVPPTLMESGFLKGQKILMLEPRRIAASGAARRIAVLLQEKCGERAGYRTRYESVVSPETKIEVITEGILTKMIQSDPELSGVGMIIFDEFHERNLQGDLSLALALDVQNALREDLRILVMSATLDTEKVVSLLGEGTPVIRSAGKVYPVETVYLPPEHGTALEKSVLTSVRFALQRQEGDLLVFLPGEGEIRKCMKELECLSSDPAGNLLQVLPLYGNLPEKEQRKALSGPEEGIRKVIVSTPVAESSVTIPGVRCVIDSGWRRTPKFSPASGMDRLETVRVSLASADQRRGRAARTGPGLCIRLWSPLEEKAFSPFSTPEILEADLASTALELAQWGVRPDTAGSLRFPDPPPELKLRQAFTLLAELGAVEAKTYSLTPHGKKLLKYPMHPRLGNMIAKADLLGLHTLGCAVSAILSERDFLRRSSSSDLEERLYILCRSGLDRMDVEKNALQRVRNALHQFSEEPLREKDLAMTGVLCAFAYPDRIGCARKDHAGEYVLANGVMTRLREEDDMRKHPFLCIPHLEGASSVLTAFLTAPLSVEEIRTYFPDRIVKKVSAQWNPENNALAVRKEEVLGCVTLSSVSMPSSTPELPREERCRVLLNSIRKQVLPWSEKERSLMERLCFLHKVMPEEYPDVGETRLMESLEEWLAPFLTERNNSLESLRGQVLADAFYNLVGMEKLLKLETLAPERLTVPSGSRIRIDYSCDPPRLPVRLQEVFGMVKTPLLAGGKVPLVLELLSPAMRPVQITSDLAHFWQNSYFLVRKEMRGRYPKHDWPENPLEVPAHRGVKRKESGEKK